MDVDRRHVVQQLGDRDRRLEAIGDLVGGVMATELRRAQVGDDVLEALAEGVLDPNPQVRWWCIQLLDHLDDPRAVKAIAGALDDRVRACAGLLLMPWDV
jgi:hypothetical protein